MSNTSFRPNISLRSTIELLTWSASTNPKRSRQHEGLSTIYTLLSIHSIAIPVANDAPRALVEVQSFSDGLTRRQSLSNTENQLSLCRPITVIFARGTIELGNVGSLAGPPFFNALDLEVGASNVAVQGVDYPATIAGYLEGGDKGGAATLAALAEQAATQCPNTQIVLSGYRYALEPFHFTSKVDGVQSRSPVSTFGRSADLRINSCKNFCSGEYALAVQPTTNILTVVRYSSATLLTVNRSLILTRAKWTHSALRQI